MKKKCDVCGYKFKANDGAICPECLASREETMSCNDFHSHLSDTPANNQQKKFTTEELQGVYKAVYNVKESTRSENTKNIIIIFAIIFFVFLAFFVIPIINFSGISENTYGSQKEPSVQTQNLEIGIPIAFDEYIFTANSFEKIGDSADNYMADEDCQLVKLNFTIENLSAFDNHFYIDYYLVANETKDTEDEIKIYPLDFLDLIDDQSPASFVVLPDKTYQKSIYYEIPNDSTNYSVAINFVSDGEQFEYNINLE